MHIYTSTTEQRTIWGGSFTEIPSYRPTVKAPKATQRRLLVSRMEVKPAKFFNLAPFLLFNLKIILGNTQLNTQAAGLIAHLTTLAIRQKPISLELCFDAKLSNPPPRRGNEARDWMTTGSFVGKGWNPTPERNYTLSSETTHKRVLFGFWYLAIA